MKICVVGNLSDTKCGISNFSHQTIHALRRAGHDVIGFDGTYPVLHRREETEGPINAFTPADLATYDVLHVVWHAITLNHYAGADWPRIIAECPKLVLSLWDCGPSDAYCPFDSWFPVKWMLYDRPGYHVMDYPVPDWVTDLPLPNVEFTVGASGVRSEGVAELKMICEQAGWKLNLPAPGVWLSIDDEIKRLARSTVNVCWYHSGATWKDRASAPSMLIAAKRPILINHDDLLAHLWDRVDLYHGTTDLENALWLIHNGWRRRIPLKLPLASYARQAWTQAATQLTDSWLGLGKVCD